MICLYNIIKQLYRNIKQCLKYVSMCSYQCLHKETHAKLLMESYDEKRLLVIYGESGVIITKMQEQKHCAKVFKILSNYLLLFLILFLPDSVGKILNLLIHLHWK